MAIGGVIFDAESAVCGVGRAMAVRDAGNAEDIGRERRAAAAAVEMQANAPNRQRKNGVCTVDVRRERLPDEWWRGVCVDERADDAAFERKKSHELVAESRAECRPRACVVADASDENERAELALRIKSAGKLLRGDLRRFRFG